MGRIVIDLCGGTGSWSKPYVEAGYDVQLVTLPDQDVRLYVPPDNVWGILAAPPCTEFAASGARWWAAKGEGPLLDGLSVLDACLRIIVRSKPQWWALENPVGRISRYLGKPVWSFQPYEFGDPWTKRTCLWGNFTIPQKSPVLPVEGGKIHRMGQGPKRAMLRSKTPEGFAKAFMEANP